MLRSSFLLHLAEELRRMIIDEVIAECMTGNSKPCTAACLVLICHQFRYDSQLRLYRHAFLHHHRAIWGWAISSKEKELSVDQKLSTFKYWELDPCQYAFTIPNQLHRLNLLHWAAVVRNKEVMEWALKYGVDPNTQQDHPPYHSGRYSLLHFQQNPERQIVSDPDKEHMSISALYIALAYRENWMTLMLLSKNVSMRVTDHLHALHVAAAYGYDWFVNRLPSDINFNELDKYQQTPLHHAAQSLYGEPALTALIQRGASINATDIWGKTPLDYCFAASSPGDVLKRALILIKAGAITTDGHTRLHHLFEPRCLDFTSFHIPSGYKKRSYKSQYDDTEAWKALISILIASTDDFLIDCSCSGSCSLVPQVRGPANPLALAAWNFENVDTSDERFNHLLTEIGRRGFVFSDGNKFTQLARSKAWKGTLSMEAALCIPSLIPEMEGNRIQALTYAAISTGTPETFDRASTCNN